MTPQIVNGWLVVPCDAHDMARVEVGLGLSKAAPRTWTPAFRDWHNGQRTAQIRSTSMRPGAWTVWVRVDGRVTGPYRLRLTGR